jgi:hypothetical protein
MRTCGNDVGPGLWKCARPQGHPGPCQPAEAQPIESGSATPRADAIRREIRDFLTSDAAYMLSGSEYRSLDEIAHIELGVLLHDTGDISEARAVDLRTRLVLLQAGCSRQVPMMQLPAVGVGR